MWSGMVFSNLRKCYIRDEILFLFSYKRQTAKHALISSRSIAAAILKHTLSTPESHSDYSSVAVWKQLRVIFCAFHMYKKATTGFQAVLGVPFWNV